MKKFKNKVMAFLLFAAVLFAGFGGTMTKAAKAATAISKVPITCYTVLSGNATTYKSINGAYSGYICKGDLCKILSVYSSGWVKVSYPTARGSKTAYTHSKNFFSDVDFSTATTKVGKSMTVYKKSDCKSSLGTVFANDNICVTGSSKGNTQVLYPLTSGGYKMGFIKGSIPAPKPAPKVTPKPAASTLDFSSLQSKYPSGSRWNGSFHGSAWQCHGFALTLGEELTGKNPRKWKSTNNLDSLKPGDIVRCKRPHTIMVTAVSGNTITYVDCNWVAKNTVKWNQKIKRSKITSTFGNLDYVLVCPK